MAKDCCKPKNEKTNRANKTAAGQIAYCVRDEKNTEREWKECARESLMCEKGWGDLESESEDEENEENDEDDLEPSEGLVLLEAEHSCLDTSCNCGLPNKLLEGIEEVSLLEVTPLKNSPVLKMAHYIQEGHVARRKRLVAPTFVMGFWECLMKTRAELKLIESSSNQQSETEQDLLSPGGAEVESPVGPIVCQELTRLS
jgi:hypothetical protein